MYRLYCNITTVSTRIFLSTERGWVWSIDFFSGIKQEKGKGDILIY